MTKERKMFKGNKISGDGDCEGKELEGSRFI
jgi:hypothetical protein